MKKQHDVSLVEYLRVGLKIEGAETSKGMVEARSVALWGHWVADADRGAGLTVTGVGGLSGVGETSPEMALSASFDWRSTGAQGSEPVLLDERSESSGRHWAYTPVALIGGCGVTAGLTGSVGIACPIDAVEVQRGCSWARKDEGEPADTPDEVKNESRAGGT